MILSWLAYYVGFVLPVILQGYESWRSGFLTPAQMLASGVATGLPFLAHTGMWSDVTLFAALMASIIALYAHQWKRRQWFAALIVGLIGSAVMHWWYVQSPFPQAHVRDGMLTSVGILHFFYMAIGIAIVTLFYTSTAHLTLTAVSWITFLLVVHVVIGTLVPLKIWAKIAQPVWYPERMVFDTPTIFTITGVTAVLCAASLWALRLHQNAEG
jgi:hypothetical protein